MTELITTNTASVADPVVDALSSQPFTALLGGAGTGKTTIAKDWATASGGLVQLCATTGIAAVNLGSGTTINAFLKYFKTEHLVDLYTSGLLTAKLRKHRRAGLQRILLDEVSMLDANQLTVLVRAIEEVNAGEGLDIEGTDEDDSDLPPLGLTLVGDFCQLPPVKAPFAFESIEWPKFSLTVLDRIWRQSNPAFVGALRAARRADGRAAVDVLQSCFHPTVDQGYDGPTVLAKNESVERYNRLRLDQLTTPLVSFKTSRWGEQSTEWKMIPDELWLKEGALVMLLANNYDQDFGRYRYVNGDLGTFLGKEIAGEPRVLIHRTKCEETIFNVERELTVPLEVGERKEMKERDELHLIKGKTKIVGGVTYCPMRVAYATTVHKSQGLSLDKVQVNLREGFMAAPGMTYVALSRARDLEGLRIVGDARTFIARCTVDPRIVRWI